MTITAKHILSLRENTNLALVDVITSARQFMESYFKSKFQQIYFKVERKIISGGICASGKIFVKHLFSAEFKENEKKLVPNMLPRFGNYLIMHL